MNKTLASLSNILFCILLGGCSLEPVTVPPVKTYTLTNNTVTAQNKVLINKSITVMPVLAASGFDTSNMLYEEKPYLLSSFVQNAWIAPPAALITPILAQALQETGFATVITGPSVSNTDYLLNTTLISLYQDFTVNPSVIVLNLDATLINNTTNQVVADKTFHFRVNTKENTPYGGVLAANAAVGNAVTAIAQFLVTAVAADIVKH